MVELEYLITYARDGSTTRESSIVFTGNIYKTLEGMKRPGVKLRNVIVSIIDRDPVFPDTMHFVEHFAEL